MLVSHTPAAVSVCFDEENLVSPTGLMPVMRLAKDAGLHSLVAGMVAGADSIDEMTVLRHGGMKQVFKAAYASSTLGSFLRAFIFGHV